MKFSLQSYLVSSNSAHPQVDIYDCIWKNEIPHFDFSDVSVLLMVGILVGIVLAISHTLAFFLISFLWKISVVSFTLFKKEQLKMRVI